MVLHHLCTNPHNDSAQNCQFPWGSVTHMSGAPSERQKLSDDVLPRNSGVGCSSPLERLLRPWTEFLLSHHPQSSKKGPHWNDSGDGRRRGCQKTSPRDRWSHANCATEPRVTKMSPLWSWRGNASVTVPPALGMQRLGDSNQVLGCRVQDWGTGVTGFKTEVPDSRLECRVQVGGDVVGNLVRTRKCPHLSGSVKNCQSPQCQTTSVRP